MGYKMRPELFQRLDVSKFQKMIPYREQTIQAAPAKEITAEYRINAHAKELHPDIMTLVVSEIIEHPGAASKTYVFRAEDGGALPYFRAGQYISLKMKIGDSVLSRPYSLNSSPREALEGKYEITVRANPTGFAADWLLETVKVGDKFRSTSPQGFFYYEDLRDPAHIIGCAGGSGITPFLSMAREIAHGTLDADLTILYGSVQHGDIVCGEELDRIAAACPRVKIVNIMSDDPDWDGEKGFVTEELIRKYSKGDVTYFFCGPWPMFFLVQKALQNMGEINLNWIVDISIRRGLI